MGGVGGESIIGAAGGSGGGAAGGSVGGAAGGSVGGVVGASAGSTGVEFEEVELSLRRAPRRVRLPPGRIS